VTWRDGVHLTGTPIWCDARRRRDVCFLSSADRVGRTGHGQLIGTAITLALVDAAGPGHLAVPLRQRFTLGTVRLELIPSGRGFGAAALHADVAGKTVLYAGTVRTSSGGVGDAAELRACDAVVVAAPYGEPRHQFPPLAAAIAAAIDWTRAQLAAGRRPVLVVDSVLDGLEVASRLAAEAIAIAGGRALREAANRIAELVPPPQLVDGEVAIGRSIPPGSQPPGSPRSTGPRATASKPRQVLRAEPAAGAELVAPSHLALGSQTFSRLALDATSGVPPIAPPGREPRAIVWLDADRAQLARVLADRPAATALVSARAIEGAAGCDTAFAWASAADRAQLLAWIEATGARDVFVTGACADAIVAALGARARVIGPPHQMPLFPREATS
jgi:putative mRNA 3-end processing factor